MPDLTILDADSLLAIDIGTITTRALLFDTVDGVYRFVAGGMAPSTLSAPHSDPGDGIRRAIHDLQAITGRVLVDVNQILITPSNADGTGIDSVAVTLSGGKPLKIIVLGLLEEVSVESARHLAETIYSKIVDTISMTDRRKIETQIDDILRLQPDIIIAAGGTDDGASKSVLRILDAVGIASLIMPRSRRPRVLFAGNPSVAKQVQSVLEEIVPLQIAPNIRPSLETEQLGPGQIVLRDLFRSVEIQRHPTLKEADGWASGRLMPSANGFGRIIQFLSRYYEANKGVLGVDLGASSTSFASAFKGNTKLSVFTGLGMGASLIHLLDGNRPASAQTVDIARWLPFEISSKAIKEYIYHKAVYPHSLPATAEELALEHALAREVLRAGLILARGQFPVSLRSSQAVARPGMLPFFEPIVASGSLLSKAPLRAQALLILLDALEPCGITTLVLDQHNLLNSLGAAAELNSLLAVQVLDSGALLNLGTVIAPVGNARFGTPVLRVRMKLDTGEEKQFDVNQGSLQTIPLAPGQVAQLHLRPLQRHHIGFSVPGRGGSLRVVGGALGIVIDARGRPLKLNKDRARQIELTKKWLWALGKQS